jgi:hypothetical protein
MAKISISDLYSTSIKQISNRNDTRILCNLSDNARRKVIGGFNFYVLVPDDIPPPYKFVPDPDADRIRLSIPSRTSPYPN